MNHQELLRERFLKVAQKMADDDESPAHVFSAICTTMLTMSLECAFSLEAFEITMEMMKKSYADLVAIQGDLHEL